MHWHLGIDPGDAGAAVALAPDGVAEVLWSWRTSSTKMRHINLLVAQAVDGSVQVFRFQVAGPHALGQLLGTHMMSICAGEPCVVAHEGIWTPRNAGAGSALKLALWTGRLIGPVEAACHCPAQVYQPSHWRKVAGVGNQPGHKERAVEVVPVELPGLAELIEAAGRAKSSTHEVEAGGVALCLFRSSGSVKSSVAASKRSLKPSACPSASGRGPRAPRAARKSADPKTSEAP